MALTFEQFFSAIAEQESGGRYNAVGVWVRGDRAYGKYQVMGANIPSWTKKHFGRSLTPQQFLNSPKAQEAVARGVLKSYWNKYGARGAASAWYSGNPNLHNNTSSQSGGPSIKTYVDQVLAKASKYPSGGGSTTSSSSNSPSTTAAKEKELSGSELAEQYGFVEGLLNSTPELKALFNKAIKGQWTSQKFQAELRDTKWWKSKSESERKWLVLGYGDPATANQKTTQERLRIRQLGNQMGILENAFTRGKMNEAAYNVLAKGWTDAQVRYFLGQFVQFGAGAWQGEGGEALSELISYSYQFGIKNTDKYYQDAARSIIRGLGTLQDYKSQIQKQAITLFPQWEKEILAGQTASDLASPYMQTMANLLELPQGSVNLFDPTIKKALQYRNPTSGQSEIKPLWQFENELRSDTRWRKTKNAQDSMMQVAHQVLADFGFAY